MSEQDKNCRFFGELTRRRVIRAAAAYIFVGCVVVQVGSIVFSEFDAPAWAMRALIIVFAAGFPPVILLAWTIDFSPRFRPRTGLGVPALPRADAPDDADEWRDVQDKFQYPER